MNSIKLDKSICNISFNKDKSLLGLCLSNLTNSNWNGSVEFFETNQFNIQDQQEFSSLKPKQSIDFYAGVTCLEWIRPTKCLVSADDSNIYFIDTNKDNSNKEENIYSENDDDILFKNTHHNQIISHLNYCENTQQLLSSGYDNIVKQYDLNTNSQVTHFNIHYKKVNMSLWSKINYDLFLSVSDNGMVIWDSRININSKEEDIKSVFIKESNMAVLSCCWDIENENIFYIGLKNGEIKQFDIRNSSELTTWKQHELAINELLFNPNDKSQLISISDDAYIKSINIKDNSSTSIYKSNDFIKSFDFDFNNNKDNNNSNNNSDNNSNNNNNNNIYIGSIDRTLKKIKF